jgi:hypothetical protein
MIAKILVLFGIGLIGSIGIPSNGVANQNTTANSKSTSHNTNIKTIDWNILCEKFPLNSHCLKGAPEIIKIPLKDYGAKDEWIRIDKIGNQVKLLYTRQTSEDLVGKALDGIVDAAVPFPVPFSIYPKQWSDRKTTKIIFQPDNCQLNSQENMKRNLPECTISGKNLLDLPPAIDIRAGIFTLEYKEGELIRTITFRIPTTAKSETGLIIVE